MAFNVEGARAAGYTDAEIAQYMAKQRAFDYAKASQHYSDAEIIDHLQGVTSPTVAPEVQAERDQAAVDLKKRELAANPGDKNLPKDIAWSERMRDRSTQRAIDAPSLSTIPQAPEAPVTAPMSPQAIEHAAGLDIPMPASQEWTPQAGYDAIKRLPGAALEAARGIGQGALSSAAEGAINALAGSDERRAAMGLTKNTLGPAVGAALAPPAPTDPAAAEAIRLAGLPGAYFDAATSSAGKGAENLTGSPMVGRMVKESLDIAPWGLGLPAGDAKALLLAQRAKEASPGLGTQISDKLGLRDAAYGPDVGTLPVQTAIHDLQQRTGRVPTAGEVSGTPTGQEMRARKYAPGAFVENEQKLAAAAIDIKNQALESLSVHDIGPAGQPFGAQDMGNAIERVTEQAKKLMREETGPVFDEAQRSGVVVDVRAYRNEAEKWLHERAKALSPAERAELEDILKSTADTVGPDNFVVSGTQQPISDIQDIISRNKDRMRQMADGGTASPLFKKVLGDLNKKLDGAYDEALKAADPKLRDKVQKARELYRGTMQDLESDTMVTLLRKKPEDIGNSLHAAGTVSEIQDLRTALQRSIKQDPSLAGDVSRIDAGLVKGYLQNMDITKLTDKLENQKFVDTMKEILVGRGAANPRTNMVVLRELDKTAAALQMANPQTVAKAGRVGLPGVGGSVGPAAIGTGITGSPVAGVTLGLAASAISAIGGARYYGAVAKAMTQGADPSLLRAFTRTAQLAAATSHNPKAETALRDQMIKLNEELIRNGLEPIAIPQP